MDALEDFEVTLLLSAMEHRWGYDFRGYSRASIKRRVRHAMIRHRMQHVSAMIPRVLHEPEFFQDVVRDFSITVTEMFRDPQVWNTLREEVFPRLATWPYFKLWHAACATGEEVYSMAILLQEANLLERATIYATDFNDAALATGKRGVYARKDMGLASRNYAKAGGKQSLSAYFRGNAAADTVRMIDELQSRIVWANHNLVTDEVFGEMNLIVCRNVLIYFTQPLQNRVLELFTKCLPHGGLLCLGNKESIDFSSVVDWYEPVAAKDRLFRRIDATSLPPCSRSASVMHAQTPDLSVPPLVKPDKAVSIVIAIGCSLGGMHALQVLLSELSSLKDGFAGNSIAVLITQHVATASESAMAEVLQLACALRVKEAEEGETIEAGTVYLAPADYHLLLNDDWTLALSCDEPDHFARPAINVMFESVAEVCAERSIGVLLTGANDDGARGLAKIHGTGGFTIVQDPIDAASKTMPRAAISLMKPDRVLPLVDIAAAIEQQVYRLLERPGQFEICT